MILESADAPIKHTSGETTDRAGQRDGADSRSLETMPPDQLLRELERMWKSQKYRYERLLAEGEVHERQRDGQSNYWVDKSQDRSHWIVYAPPGVSDVPVASFNLADRVLQRLVSQVYADEPVPEAEPATGQPEDRDAAEFATRILLDIQSEANLDDLEKHRTAFDMASSWGSGFVHYYVDPKGGGQVPVELMAHPLAQDPTVPLLDPRTGQPARPEELTRRYVTDQGLSENAGGAQLRWLPKLDADVYPAKHVRFIPADATGIWDADGVLLVDYITVRKAQLDYADQGLTLGEDDIKFRPEDTRMLMPRSPSRGSIDPNPEDTRDRLVARFRCYWKRGPLYPNGLRLTTVGKQLVARGPWMARHQDGRTESLDLPVTQIKQLRDPTSPMGRAMMKFLGGAQEQRIQVLSAIQDHLDRVQRRKTFVPYTSTYQPGDAQLALETHIPIAPGQEPKYEDIPPLDQALFPFYQEISREIRDAVGLQETGSGLQVPSVTSGRQALAIISQVHAGLSEIRQNAERAYIRGCRIQLQLVRAFYRQPQLMRWCGEDGEYKMREWMGSDLGSTRDVRIRQGSFTMMAPLQKIELLFGWAQHGAIPPDQVQEMVASKIQAIQGIQDQAHLLRVRRQIEVWRKGPPPTWVPGQPVAELQPILADNFPPVAQLRLQELGRAMASTVYEKADPAWRMHLDLLYQAAGMALMPAPQPATPPSGGASPPVTPEAPAGSPAAGAARPPKLQKAEAAGLNVAGGGGA
jgi:hypothetical protein